MSTNQHDIALPEDFDHIYQRYRDTFGSPPYIGLDDEQLGKLYQEMAKALNGERNGDIRYEEFYSKLPPEAEI